jgi:hypothetical protein
VGERRKYWKDYRFIRGPVERGVIGVLTEVRMCHASKEMIEINIQSTYVDRRDTIRVKKMELVNNAEKVNFDCDKSCFTALNGIKISAKERYLTTC